MTLASIVKANRGWYLIHNSFSENIFFTSRKAAKERAESMGLEIYQDPKAAAKPKREAAVIRGSMLRSGSEGHSNTFVIA